MTKALKLSAVMLVGILTGLLAAEGLARCFLPYPLRQISLLRMRAPDLQMDAGTDLRHLTYNPFLQRRPNAEWTCDGKTPERMNNEGFRDRDFVISKPPGMTRIAILGDSFTEGWMGPRAAAFPRVLESELGPGFEVLNFGLANRSPLRYLALYDKIVRPYRPDLVLICLYRNDLAEDETLRPYVAFDAHGIPRYFDFQRYFRHTPRMPQTKWEKRCDKWQWYFCRHSRLYPYAAVYFTVDPEFRRRTLEAPPPDAFARNWKNTSAYLERTEELVRSEGAQLWVAYVPDRDDFEALNPLCGALEAWAKERNVPCFPTTSILSSSDTAALYIPGDGHFSVAGHRRYAEELGKWILPMRNAELGIRRVKNQE